MRTIGKHYSGPVQYSPYCDVCGIRWLRSDMTMKSDGTLVCPDDRDGRTSRELDVELALTVPPPNLVNGGSRG
jgi:hypothetical protein